jgi:aminopeptidase N
MGDDADTRAWEQIAGALGTIEHAARGSPGHDAFAALARSIIAPVATRLGWEPRAGETPDVQRLRRTLLEDLGALGDAQTVAEARRRFAAFVTDRSAIRPDDQSFILELVMRQADPASFEKLHAIAREEKDETAQRRDYRALMQVGDGALARQAAQLALSDEIPPQADAIRIGLVMALAEQHPALAWSTFTANADRLLAPNPKYAPLITAEYVPESFWEAAPAEELERWVRSRVPAEMAPNVARGMEAARIRQAEKPRLAAAADAYLHARPAQ